MILSALPIPQCRYEWVGLSGYSRLMSIQMSKVRGNISVFCCKPAAGENLGDLASLKRDFPYF